MFVITGATGNTGKRIADALLAAGKKVRVVGRSADKLKPLADQGADVFAGDVTDAAAMTRALDGAAAAYLMVPPHMGAESMAAFQDAVIAAYAAAIEKAGLKHAVTLSSIGAQHAEKVGPIKGLHRLEQRLNRIAGLNVLHLRPGHFMENLLTYIGLIKSMGMIAGTQRGDKPMPWTATRDTAAVAAGRLLRLDFTASSVLELVGPRDTSMEEAAKLVGIAIGKPGLGYNRFPAMMVRPALAQMGMSGDVIANIIEMYEGVDNGLVVTETASPDRSLTPTRLETFIAEELVPVFNA